MHNLHRRHRRGLPSAGRRCWQGRDCVCSIRNLPDVRRELNRPLWLRWLHGSGVRPPHAVAWAGLPVFHSLYSHGSLRLPNRPNWLRLPNMWDWLRIPGGHYGIRTNRGDDRVGSELHLLHLPRGLCQRYLLILHGHFTWSSHWLPWSQVTTPRYLRSHWWMPSVNLVYFILFIN